MNGLKGLLAGVLALAVLATGRAAAQDPDPLALGRYLPGHDAVASRQLLAQSFSGVWNVVHTDDGGQTRTGRADVASNGGTISLYLDGPEDRTHYRMVEADAVRFGAGDTGLIGGLVARFEKVAPPVLGPDGGRIATAWPLPLDPAQTTLAFKKDEFNLDLHVVWAEAPVNRLQVTLGLELDGVRLQGVWNEEETGGLSSGGLATWIRGDPVIDGVLVVENQLDPEARTGYPYLADGSPNEAMRPERTLVVYGRNLPETSDRADLQSFVAPVAYGADIRGPGDKERLVAAAFERAGKAVPDPLEALIVKVRLGPGVAPGVTEIAVNGATGAWPLIFADQIAALRFIRTAKTPTEVFFEGDAGFVELAYAAPIPSGPVAVRLMKGDENPEEIAVLMATYVDDEDPDWRVYRSDPLHFYSVDDPFLTPPPDEAALRVPVLEGMVLQARIIDPAQALTIPTVARAEVRGHPEQLGTLWHQALIRVAACHGELIGEYDTYQNEVRSDISKLIIDELATRSIDITNGDHAAALLIRDEFVRMTRAILPRFRAQAEDVGLMRQARAAAARTPQIAASPFWRDSVATYVTSTFLFFERTTEYSLAETLDLEEIARRHGEHPSALVPWAESSTTRAAEDYIGKIEAAADRADGAGDCDIGELLLIAGHRAQPVVDAILPRLVKWSLTPGPPETKYWTADAVAQGYVQSLYVKGAAVRALEEYSEADTNVAVAKLAIATAGLGLAAEVVGSAAAAFWLAIADISIDLALALQGVDDYYAGESIYEFAQGAAPVMGEAVLDDALAGRRSALATALGFLAPGLKGAANFRQLRHFRSISKGRAIFDAGDDVLSDLTRFSDADRTNLAAYFADMSRKVDGSGLEALSEADRAAYGAFQKYFEAETAAVSAAADLPPVDPNQTVAINPGSADPNEAATVISPNPWAPRPDLVPEPVPRPPNPNDAVNIYELDPGERLAARGITEIDIRRLIAKSARGESLTTDELLDKIDYMRVQRRNLASGAASE